MCGRSSTFRGLPKTSGASPPLKCLPQKSSTRLGHSPEKDVITSRKVKDLPHIERQSRVTSLQTNLTSAKEPIPSSPACAGSRHAFSVPPQTFLESSDLRPGNRSCCRH